MAIVRIMLHDLKPTLTALMGILVLAGMALIYWGFVSFSAYILDVNPGIFASAFGAISLICVFLWMWISSAIERSQQDWIEKE